MNNRDFVAKSAAAGTLGTTLHFCSKTVAVVLLLSLILAGSKVLLERKSVLRASLPAPRVSAASSHGRAYFQTGQWLADIRTTVAAFHYLLDYDDSGYLDTNSRTTRTAIGASESQDEVERKSDGFTTDRRLRPKG